MLIAHVTDMHIRQEEQLVFRQVDTAAYLRRCVGHLNALETRPDLVLFTGDLVDSPRPAAYIRLRELLAELQIPYRVIPGNHDGRDAMRTAFPDHGYLFQDSRFLHHAEDMGPLRLVGLDTTIPSSDEGELCGERLTWLNRTLQDAPDRPTLLYLHHPPFVSGLAFMDRYRCRNGTELAEILLRNEQVIGLLCGHLHRCLQTQWCGRPAVVAPSPAHSFGLDLGERAVLTAALEPPACMLHAWHKDRGLISHLCHVGEFTEVYRKELPAQEH